jgi:ribosomal subunit interface protein
MRTRVKTTGFELSESLTVLVDEKIVAVVEKLLGRLDDREDIVLDVELAKTTRHHQEGKIWKCEANLVVPHVKNVIRAEEFSESMEGAVDGVKDKLEREIKKYKEKISK